MLRHFVIFTVSSAASAQPIFTTTPQWQSADMQVSTGGALVDLDRDGWLDFIVANGNDILSQRLVVYRNTGAGTFETSPSYQSAATYFHGHLDTADVNGDGWTDVAVAILLPNGGASAHLYLNNNGTLATTPAWSASITAESFGIAFGDINTDGRPDLALASGWPYDNRPAINVVYLNTGGALAAAPSWQTPTPRNFMNCLWLDADHDGRLDLCYTGANTDSFVFLNTGTTLQTAPSYRTMDVPQQFALMAASGDVTGDGRADLIIADNNQLFGGSGRFRRYAALPTTLHEIAAGWTYFDGYASALALGDLDHDGDLDLVSGEWFGRARYFLNTGAGLPAAPNWTSAANTTTIEKIILGDVDNAALRSATAVLAPDQSRRLFFLGRQPIRSIDEVLLDGLALGPSQYTFNTDNGWVAVAAAPASELRVSYTYSLSLDAAITNWDSNRPNQLYLNQLPPPCPSDFNADGFVNGVDFDAFIQAFELGDAAADFDRDGFLTGLDFDAFVLAFEAGC